MTTQPNHSSNVAPRPGKSPDGSEIVTQQERGVHGDNEHTNDATSEATGEFRVLSTPANLPPWLSEKFHHKQGAGGKFYLSPNPEFLAAVIKDSVKFQDYGYRCMIDENGQAIESNERKASDDMAATFTLIVESLNGFDESEREVNSLKRYLTERVTSNIVYAAITQFEIDNWAARAAAQNKDASDHQNFGEKIARRDEFAHNGAVFHRVLSLVFPDVKIVTYKGEGPAKRIDFNAYEKQAKSLIYQQARMRTQELAAPDQLSQQEQQSRAAAIMSSRPFA